MSEPEPSSSPESQGREARSEISHDKLFKTAFRFFLKDLIELVHPELAAVLELEHVKFLDEDLFADFRKEGHVEPDLVAETTTREGEPRLVLLHLEVEGRFRRAIDRRVLRYSMHLALKSDKPVLSVVVFLKGGTGGVRVREVRTTIGLLVVWRFRYLAFGLSQCLAEEYVGRPQPLAAALAALMRSQAWGRVEHKLRCLRAIGEAEGLDLNRRYVLARIVDTYIELDEVEIQRFSTELERESSKEVQDMVVTWDEALAESKAEGLAEGKAKGLAEGRVQAMQESILRLSQRLPGVLSSGFDDAVRSIEDLERLHSIFDRVLDANSAAEVDLG